MSARTCFGPSAANAVKQSMSAPSATRNGVSIASRASRSIASRSSMGRLLLHDLPEGPGRVQLADDECGQGLIARSPTRHDVEHDGAGPRHVDFDARDDGPPHLTQHVEDLDHGRVVAPQRRAGGAGLRLSHPPPPPAASSPTRVAPASPRRRTRAATVSRSPWRPSPSPTPPKPPPTHPPPPPPPPAGAPPPRRARGPPPRPGPRPPGAGGRRGGAGPPGQASASDR